MKTARERGSPEEVALATAPPMRMENNVYDNADDFDDEMSHRARRDGGGHVYPEIPSYYMT